MVLLFTSHYTFSQTRKVGTTIELTEGAINLFINDQYNKAGIPNTINGNVSGVTYNIDLYLPNIRLLDNRAKIEFGFKIVSNVFNGDIGFEDDVSFFVPSIEELTLKGVSNNFKQKVNGLNLHQVLKTAIIGAWDGLELEVKQMALAEKLEKETEWLKERSISIVDPFFSLSFDVVPGKLNITVNTHLEGREYFINSLSHKDGKLKVRVGAGCQVKIKKINIYDSAGRLIRTRENLGSCPKKGILEINAGSSLAFGMYFTKILFETENTFYLRAFKNYPNSNYSTAYEVLN